MFLFDFFFIESRISPLISYSFIPVKKWPSLYFCPLIKIVSFSVISVIERILLSAGLIFYEENMGFYCDFSTISSVFSRSIGLGLTSLVKNSLKVVKESKSTVISCKSTPYIRENEKNNGFLYKVLAVKLRENRTE